jgi:hypothetical protein
LVLFSKLLLLCERRHRKSVEQGFYSIVYISTLTEKLARRLRAKERYTQFALKTNPIGNQWHEHHGSALLVKTNASAVGFLVSSALLRETKHSRFHRQWWKLPKRPSLRIERTTYFVNLAALVRWRGAISPS